jgi:hypothetical protein
MPDFYNKAQKSPFHKGGFRWIYKELGQIPPDPPLQKGGITCLISCHINYECHMRLCVKNMH